MRAVRRSFPNRGEASAVICRKALAEAKRFGARNVLSYAPLSAEADTTMLNRLLLENGFSVYLPRMTGETSMIACPAGDLTVLKPGRYGFDEPEPSEEGICRLAFVPLVAFDRKKYRLGQGKGCYDRYLASHPMRTVGLAFSCQEAETVFPEEFDIPLDKIITESLELE